MTKGAIGFAISLLLLACSRAPGPAEWRFEDGRRLVDGDTALTVVLVMDPSEAFTCAAMLMDWLEWRRIEPQRFRLVFTRQPTQTEIRRLRAVRLPVFGTLANGPRHGTPMEVVLHSGRVVFADSGVTTARGSSLLPRLRDRALADAMLELSTILHSAP